MNPVGLGMLIGLGIILGIPTLLLLVTVIVKLFDRALKRTVESVF